MNNNKQDLVKLLGEDKVKALDVYASKDQLGLTNYEVAKSSGMSRSTLQTLIKTEPAMEYLRLIAHNNAVSEQTQNNYSEQSLCSALNVAKEHIYKEVAKGSIKHIEILLKMNETLERIEEKERQSIEDCDIDAILESIHRDFPDNPECINCQHYWKNK